MGVMRLNATQQTDSWCTLEDLKMIYVYVNQSTMMI